MHFADYWTARFWVSLPAFEAGLFDRGAICRLSIRCVFQSGDRPGSVWVRFTKEKAPPNLRSLGGPGVCVALGSLSPFLGQLSSASPAPLSCGLPVTLGLGWPPYALFPSLGTFRSPGKADPALDSKAVSKTASGEDGNAGLRPRRTGRVSHHRRIFGSWLTVRPYFLPKG